MFGWFMKKPDPKPAVNIEEIPRYPPFQIGLPVTPVDLLLESQGKLLVRIYQTIGLPREEHRRHIEPLIRRYAEYVHLLPASQAHHHRGSGGLFRHGLEVGLVAVKKSKNYVYGMEYEPQVRRRVKVKWRVGMFVAGLCHDIGKPAIDLRVTDKAGDRIWSPMARSLSGWGEDNAIERYFLHWTKGRHGKHEGVSTMVLPMIMDAALREWLSEDGTEVLEFINWAISGTNASDRNVRAVVDADHESVAADLAESQIDPYSLALGVPVEQHLLDTMRRLTRAEDWKVNCPGARVWVFDGRVHLVWPAAAEDLRQALAADNVNGIPQDPKVMADILIDRKLAVERPVEGSLPHRYWRMAPLALEKNGRRVALNMLRLAPECKLFAGPLPESVPYTQAAVTEDRYTEIAVAPPDRQQADSANIETRPGSSQDSSRSTVDGDDDVPTGGADTPSPTDPPQADAETTARSNIHTLPVSAEGPSDPPEQDHRGTPAPDPPAPMDGESPVSSSQARAWLAGRGRAGEILAALVKREALRFDSRGCAMTDYPDEFEAEGLDPLDTVMALENERMLVHDAVNPLGKVHQRDGRRVIILVEPVSRRLRPLCREADPSGSAGSGVAMNPSSPRPQGDPTDANAPPDRKRKSRPSEDPVRSSPQTVTGDADAVRAPSSRRSPSVSVADPASSTVGTAAGSNAIGRAIADMLRRLRAADETIPYSIERLDSGAIGVDGRVLTWYATRAGIDALALTRALMERSDCDLDQSGARLQIEAFD